MLKCQVEHEKSFITTGPDFLLPVFAVKTCFKVGCLMWLLVSVIYGKPYIYIVACEQIKSLMSDMFIHPVLCLIRGLCGGILVGLI